MINKQKLWFLTLFSLILVLSVYYITMPSELLTTANVKNNKKEVTTKVTTSSENILTMMQIESDEERASLANEYNEILTSKDTTTEEKNNAYDGLKQLDEIKAKEENLKSKLKEKLNIKSFIKIDGNNINVTIKKKDHDYSLANNIMRLIQEEYKDKVFISVKFQN